MSEHSKPAVAVYCAVGAAIAKDGRTLVYGGGGKGIMGVVSAAALQAGGKVVGVVPYAMVAAGGEGEDRTKDSPKVFLDEAGREQVETIVVDSMHERKVEMAKRVNGFIGLPGGFGTFEEVLEVTTWTQLGIHDKPVVLVNVLSFWDPLRHLISNGINAGYIRPSNANLIIFVDGPSDHAQHLTFDWGKATTEAIGSWTPRNAPPLFDWSIKLPGSRAGETKKDYDEV
ncbi:hypothetical protein CVT24_010567 [Panaeolus cyanescens]|uniref:Cytokinin riboside 5'-monophosphate phosphoribohydrolase n=1 Tax=Panaeolus cyanescens TaxID=181874 RepID=A0A409YYK8_9AGAR|nr:hypothetical protein CVT24_010567 [Panaeolus cyanescens]